MRSQAMAVNLSTTSELFFDRSKRFISKLKASGNVHLFLFFLVTPYVGGLIAIAQFVDKPLGLTVAGFLAKFIGIIVTTLFGVLIWRFIHMVYSARPEHPIAYLAKDIWQFISNRDRLLNAIPATIILAIVIYCFTTIKNMIPVVNPYSWDMAFMELDKMLHFGIDPWRILQPVLGYWPITFLINIFYNMWFIVIWVVWIIVAFAKTQSELRLQYLLAYFLSWTVGGSLLAIMFSSVGPAYYGHLVDGPNPYAPLMSYLRETHSVIPLWVVQTQDMLWESYINNKDSFGSGISAMPSLHNTTAMLIALLGWQINRKVGIAGSLFALFIFIGSIHLGWHYAVDAYLGFAIAFASWWISGRFVRWYMARPAIRRDLLFQQEA